MNNSRTKTLSLADVCTHVGGRLLGDPAVAIEGVCPLDDQVPGRICFLKETNVPRVSEILKDARAAAILLPLSLETAITDAERNLVFVADPYAALVSLIPFFRETPRFSSGISPQAVVHPGARLGEGVSVGPFSVIADRVEIGAGTTIHPHVVIYPNVKIGAHCLIHAGVVIREDCTLGDDMVIQPGAVIGSEGFGYTPDPRLGLRAVPQIGGVKLGNRVDVGANSCVDRATLGNTTIGEGTKLDNLVQIGHNARIGTNAIICGQVGIAGSATVGDRVVLAGNAGVADHITVASDVRVAAKTGVTISITEKGDYAGQPPVPVKLWLRQHAALKSLPEMVRWFKRNQKADEEK